MVLSLLDLRRNNDYSCFQWVFRVTHGEARHCSHFLKREINEKQNLIEDAMCDPTSAQWQCHYLSNLFGLREGFGYCLSTKIHSLNSCLCCFLARKKYVGFSLRGFCFLKERLDFEQIVGEHHSRFRAQMFCEAEMFAICEGCHLLTENTSHGHNNLVVCVS